MFSPQIQTNRIFIYNAIKILFANSLIFILYVVLLYNVLWLTVFVKEGTEMKNKMWNWGILKKRNYGVLCITFKQSVFDGIVFLDTVIIWLNTLWFASENPASHSFLPTHFIWVALLATHYCRVMIRTCP